MGSSRVAKGSAGGDHSFRVWIWALLTLANWLLDFGRPIFMFYVHTPRNLPSIGDALHLIYNLSIPLLLASLFRSRSLSHGALSILSASLTVLVIGASIHLVGDSVTTRLLQIGYNFSQPVRENNLFAGTPEGVVDAFELIYLYDEVIGHYLWYVPYFAIFFAYFLTCFTAVRSKNQQSQELPLIAHALLPLSAVYYWYLATEGQIFPLFAVVVVGMVLVIFLKGKQKETLDRNGKFLFYSFFTAAVLCILWAAALWENEEMRNRYPSVMYMPEPWTLWHSDWLAKHWSGRSGN